MRKIALFLGLSLLLITGCTNGTSSTNEDDNNITLTPAQEVKNSSNKMTGLDNFSTKLVLDIEGKQDGETQSLAMIISGKIDLKNKLTSMNADMFGLSVEMYSEEKDDKVITYTKNPYAENEEWIKVINTQEEAKENYNVNTAEFLNLIDNASKFEKMNSDVTDMEKYGLTLSNDDLKEYLDLAGESLEDADYNENGTTEISIYVTKEGYVGKMIIDMKNLIIAEEGVEFTKVLFTLEYNKFNESSVTIPSDVIKNAVLGE